MAEEVNEEIMLKELIEIYLKFLNDKSREEAIKEAIRYDRKYGGLVSEHYIKYISPELAEAIGRLSTIYQYGLRPKEVGYSNAELIHKAKEVLLVLKK